MLYLYISLGIVAVVIALLLVVGRICFKLSLMPRPIKDIGASDDAPALIPERVIDEEWWGRVGAYKSEIKTHDGLRLSVNLVDAPAKGKRVLIALHGRSSYAYRVQRIAEVFYARGYNIVAMDARSHGESEGEYSTMCYRESKDIITLIGYVKERYGEDCEIVIHGISMGGATVCMVAGESLPKNVRAIISDCAYTSVHDELYFILTQAMSMPVPKLLLFCLDFYSHLFKGFSVYDGNPERALCKATVPMLFIHGAKDRFVPYAMMARLYDACASHIKECVTIDEGEHGNCYETDSEKYVSVIDGFLHKIDLQ